MSLEHWGLLARILRNLKFENLGGHELKLFNITKRLFIRDCKNPQESAVDLRLWDAACYPAKVTGETSNRVVNYKQLN